MEEKTNGGRLKKKWGGQGGGHGKDIGGISFRGKIRCPWEPCQVPWKVCKNLLEGLQG